MAITQQREQFGQIYRFTNTLPAFVTRQCVRCGSLVGGTMDGLKVINGHNLVVLLQGPYIEHCVCDNCHENEEADYFQTR